MRARRALIGAIAVTTVSLVVLTRALAWDDGLATGLTVLASGLALALGGAAATRIILAIERGRSVEQAGSSETRPR